MHTRMMGLPSSENKKLSYRKQIARQLRIQRNNSEFSGGEFLTAEEAYGTPFVSGLLV